MIPHFCRTDFTFPAGASHSGRFMCSRHAFQPGTEGRAAIGDLDVLEFAGEIDALRRRLDDERRLGREFQLTVVGPVDMHTGDRVAVDDGESRIDVDCRRDIEAEERKEQHLVQEKPALDAVWLWIETNKDKIAPKSKLRKAMNYAENNKKGLEAFLEDGNCNLSNNWAENSIRPFTIGRKNWLFSGSPKGAAASAAIYRLIETCKANKINEYNYLKYLFETLPNIPFLREPQLLEDHLPWSEKIQKICK